MSRSASNLVSAGVPRMPPLVSAAKVLLASAIVAPCGGTRRGAAL
ncbi:hypothetical protein [Plantactinospora sp. B5E13]